MAFLPALGTISYNGYTFNSATRTRIMGRAAYDRSGRTITHVVYTISLSTYVAETSPGAGADAVVADLRQRLMSPGRDLRYMSQGFGDFQINVSSTKDVLWGPKPVMLALEPIGAKSIWRVDWQVEVAIPECQNAQYERTPMAFGYEVAFSIDPDGYTVRTYSGYLEIPMTRAGGGRVPPDIVDAYRERIKVAVPRGFRRESQNYVVSDDERRLDWSIVDQEYPPEGLVESCTDASGSHSIRAVNASLANWTATISATYTVARNKPRSDAYEAFFALFDDRKQKAEAQGQEVRTTAFDIEQGLYRNGRTISFSASYLFVTSLEKLLKTAAIWELVPKTDWDKWKDSVADSTGPRGFAQLKLKAGDNVIVDLCGGSTSLGVVDDIQHPTLRPDSDKKFKPTGWIRFEMQTDLHEESGWGVMKTLPKEKKPEVGGATMRVQPTSFTFQPTLTNQQKDPFVTLRQLETFGDMFKLLKDAIPVGTDGQPNPSTDPPPDLRPPTGTSGGTIAQARAVPTYVVRCRGYAVTVGIPIPCPELRKFEDADLIPSPYEKPRFSNRVLGYNLDQPIIYCEWILPYIAIYPQGFRKRT